MSRRGPDEQTIYDDGYLSFVFRRLSIVDVEHGTQPIWNEDESLFVCVNGEIYNHRELREELGGKHRFRTQSDSEAVLHLYEELGVDCFKKLNGMFAVILYCAKSRRLILARDRLGIKPLYWTRTENGLIFASELKALLLHPDCPRELNWRDLDLPMEQQKQKISSYVQGVHHLQAGSHLSVSPDGEISGDTYWSLDQYICHEDAQFDPQKAIADYEQLIADSTTKRLMSDVPVGLYLSGGIDSSLLAAIASRTNKNLHCFTVVEETTVASGDAPQAEIVANQLGLPLYGARLDVKEIAANFSLRDFERMVMMIESPRFDPEWIFKCQLHRFAKKEVPGLKVVLLGQGADEFAGGYSNRAGSNFADWKDYLDSEVSKDIHFYFAYEKEIPGHLNDKINLSHFDKDMDSKSMDYHEKMLLLVSQMQHFNLWHEDRSSSFYGLEARVPYLDHRLAELMASIPDQHLESMFWDKAIVRDVLAKALPEYPKNRKKVPFIASESHSSIDDFAVMVAKQIYPSFRMLYQDMMEHPLFRSDALDDLYDTVVSDNNDSIFRAWELLAMMSIAVFERFCQHPQVFLDIVEESEGPVCERLSEDEMGRLEELYPRQIVNVQQWAISSTFQIPKKVELLSSLRTNGELTQVFLHSNGQVAKTLTIPNEDYWVVEMLSRVANHQGEPGSVSFWSGEMKVEPQQLVEALEYLTNKGFLERTA